MSAIEMGLLAILLIVFIGPFVHHKIETNLEFFLFVMGCAALTASHFWSIHVILEALQDPLPISLTVLVFGFLFKWGRPYLERWVQSLFNHIPQSLFLFLLVVLFGLISSIITAIIASLILVELLSILQLNRKTQMNIAIVACFSIGLGAALTPVGEPLSTLVAIQMHSGFWYLFQNLGLLIIPAIFALGLLAPWFHGRKAGKFP